MRLEGLGKLKNPMVSSETEPATFRLKYQLHWKERVNKSNVLCTTLTKTQRSGVSWNERKRWNLKFIGKEMYYTVLELGKKMNDAGETYNFSMKVLKSRQKRQTLRKAPTYSKQLNLHLCHRTSIRLISTREISLSMPLTAFTVLSILIRLGLAACI
jgi:hypothetical protein